MRRNAAVDANQSEIVDFLRRIGCSVAVMSSVGKGFPDLCVGYRGKNFLLEAKDGEKVASKQKLTPDQVKFHAEWNGQICVVKNVDEALEAVQKKG